MVLPNAYQDSFMGRAPGLNCIQFVITFLLMTGCVKQCHANLLSIEMLWSSVRESLTLAGTIGQTYMIIQIVCKCKLYLRC